MTTQTESVSGLFEQTFENMRKAAESNIEMQQELFRNWNANWPGFPQPENAWLDRVQKFQKEWSKTFTELLNRHRKVLDEQYGWQSNRLEEAFRVAQASDPRSVPNGAKLCAARVSKSCARPANCKPRKCKAH